MTGSALRGASARANLSRALILAGTALGTSFIPSGAEAQNVTYSGPGDYTLNQSGTITGGPRTVDVTTTSGNIDIEVGTVTSTNNGSSLGAGIAANNTGPGNITVKADAVTANGTGQSYAVDTRAASGNIAITTGTVTANSNPNSRGIYAISGGGNISIAAGTTDGGNKGIYTGSNGGVFPNVTTIVSDNATANGTSSPNAIVGQGQTVNITSGTARDTNTSGNAGTAIFANAGSGGATVHSGLAEALGNNQSAIQVYSDTGVTIVSDTARTTQTSDGISVQSGTSVSITSGTVTTTGANGARGIVVNTPAANLDITSGTISTAGTNSTAMLITGTSGTATIASDTITTQGANSIGISLTGQSGAASITSNALNTAGASATGILVNTTGPVTVASTSAATTGAGAFAISATSTTGDVHVTSGTASTSGLGSQGVWAQTTNGNIVIDAGTTTTTATGYNAGTGGTQDAVFGYASGSGAVTITSQNASSAGDYSNAIGAVGGGAVSVTSGTASTSGFQVASVYGLSRNSDVTINATNSTATGGNAYAVEGHAANGNVTIASGTASAQHGDAIYATAGGLVTVTATSAAAHGDGGTGVRITGGSVNLNIGSASSDGTMVTNAQTHVTYRADAVFAQATTGAINAMIGSATATGAGMDAVHLIADGANGAVTATITGNVSSTSGTGLWIDPPGAVNVTVASGATLAGALDAIYTNGGTNSILNPGSISSSGGPAIVATGTTTLDNSGTITGAAGSPAVQLGATDDSVILRAGSVVNGAIAGGGGTDAAVLIGSATAPTAGETLAAFTGFDSLTVQSGYWTAPSSQTDTFRVATIGSGASLAVANGPNGIGGIAATSIVANGTLVVTSGADAGTTTFGSTVVTGTGGVRFTGAGTATLDGANSLQNTGTNTVDAGASVLVTGTQGGSFVNNGTFQVGTGGSTGTFTGNLVDNGTLIVNRSDAYNFVGALSGDGTFVKQGAGTISFGSNYAFTGTTQLNGGSIRLAAPVNPNTQLDVEGSGTIDFSGTSQTVAELSGNSTTASINIDGGSLTVDQNTNTVFAGSLTGNGTLIKDGSGSLNLTGVNTYTGPTFVDGGRLAVNGSIVSPLTVNAGGTLGGTGTVGNTTIASGGTWAPGNSIGTQHVNGNVTFAAGSIFAVEANAAGQSDQIAATGTATINGGTVQVLAAQGNYAPLTNYTILTAAGGVSGKFASATSNLAFLTPYLSYGANNVMLTLGRNDISFASQAANASQVSVANAIAARGLGDPIYNAVLVQTAAGAQSAYAQLDGEIHAAVPTVITDATRRVRDAVLEHGGMGGQGLGLWVEGQVLTAQSRQQPGVSEVKTDRTGVIGGFDFGAGALRVGINGGYASDDVKLVGQGSTAQVDTKLLGADLAWTGATGFSIQVGGEYAWHDIDTARSVTVTGLSGSFASSYQGHSGQLFAEAGRAFAFGQLTLDPFVRYAHVWTTVDAARETGGTAALVVGQDERETDFASLGVRLGTAAAATPALALHPHGSVAYTHAWGDLAGVRTATFGGTGPAFAFTGAALGQDTFDGDIGLDLVSTKLRIGVSGFGSVSSEWRDYGAKASIAFRF